MLSVEPAFICGGAISRSFYGVREANILITCGSTNQNKVLERIVRAVQLLLEELEVALVVGCQADCAGEFPTNVRALKNVENMAALMQSADMRFLQQEQHSMSCAQ